MPTISTATDAFVESPHKEFVESPHKERGDVEGNLPFTYTVYTRIFSAYVYRHGVRPYNGAGFDSVFRRQAQTFENTNDPLIGGATSYTFEYVYNRYDGSPTDNSGGDAGANTDTSGHTLSSDTTTQDDADGYINVQVWSNGSNTLTITTEYDTPNKLEDVTDLLDAIFAAKLAAFAATSDVSDPDEHWMYDATGTIVSNAGFGSWAPLSFGPGHYAGFDGGVDADLYLKHGLGASKTWITSTPASAKYFSHTVQTSDYGSDPASTPSTSEEDIVVQVGDILVLQVATTSFTSKAITSTQVAPSQPP